MATTKPVPTDQPETAPPPDPPVMALRTYMCLRLGAVGLIAVLAVSLAKEYHAAGDCLQGSISAYYYTSVQSVFVGALVAIGLVMIVLWGKTPWEDGALNLAGLVSPVVAFVPTAKTNKCGLTSATGADVTTDAQKAAVIKASHDAIFNSMLAYLIVVGAILLILLGVGVVAHIWTNWAFVTEHPLAYWGPWAVAVVLYLLGSIKFWQHDRTWFYTNAHKWSAITLFVFIVVVVIDIGYQKSPRKPHPDKEPRWFWARFLKANPAPKASWGWAWTYWGLAMVMVAGATAIQLLAKKISYGFGEHRNFFVEGWMIFWLAAFWLLQTWDRRNDGAPPRTDAEVQQAQAAAP